MKKFYNMLGAVLLTPSISFGQSFATTQFDHNDCSAQLNANGILFNDIDQSRPGYFVPKEDSVASIFSMNLMAFGEDINGQLHGAIANYASSDFRSGPIAIDYNTPSYSGYAQGFWKTSKVEIDDQIANWNVSGHVFPPSILNWPGNGDVTNGESVVIAPFQDTDGDGVYNPTQGDYPLIRGDQAVFCILNDRNGVHSSGTNPMGIEVRLLFYQYTTLGDIFDQTTFVHTNVVNRGTATYYNFKFGAMMDFDLGKYDDDYMGTDLEHNMTYVYNGDPYDDYESGHPGFLENPPSVGLMILNKPLSTNLVSSNMPGTPNTPLEYRYVLNGINVDGSPVFDNNGNVSAYSYTDTITDSTGWNESALFNPLGDRRSYFSVADDDGILHWNEYTCTDFAIVYARSMEGQMFSSVDSLFQVATEIQAFYDNQNYDCSLSTLGTEELTVPEITVYPNPANDRIRIDGLSAGSYRIVAPDGKIVSDGILTFDGIDISVLPQGHYQISVSIETGTSTTTFVK